MASLSPDLQIQQQFDHYRNRKYWTLLLVNYAGLYALLASVFIARDVEMFEIGDVLKVEWDERPIRVIMSDPIEVFYDVFWPESSHWGLTRARTASYYRTTTEFLMGSATKIRSEPLSESEKTKHRPDLPMRLLRSNKVNWSDGALGPEMVENIMVKAKQLAIVPFGSKGGSQSTEKIQSSNGDFFSSAELLNAVQDMQHAKCPEVSGIGLYRLGVSGGVPSYYIWGAVDKAGNAPASFVEY